MMYTFFKSALLSSCAAVVLMAASTFQASAVYPDDDDNDDVASRAIQKPKASDQETAVNTSTSASQSTASQTSTMDDLLQGLEDVVTGGNQTENFFDANMGTLNFAGNDMLDDDAYTPASPAP